MRDSILGPVIRLSLMIDRGALSRDQVEALDRLEASDDGTFPDPPLIHPWHRELWLKVRQHVDHGCTGLFH